VSAQSPSPRSSAETRVERRGGARSSWTARARSVAYLFPLLACAFGAASVRAAPKPAPAASAPSSSASVFASAYAAPSTTVAPPEFTKITLQSCLDKCHGDKAEERKNPQPGRKTSVYVDDHGIDRSEHRGMLCVDCHPRSFVQDPHPPARRAYCPDCHQVNETRKDGVLFADIISDFQRSVHEQKNDQFRCIHCHDAHTFQLETTRSKVSEHNKVCLRCHGSPDLFRKFAKKEPPNLDKAHAWLPNRDLHWSKIRCLDCHTGYDPKSSHLILPKTLAVKKCEACHNQNPTQLLRLYSRMRAKERAGLGFINGFIINDSYVIGATRNRTLDFFAILIMGGTGAGIMGHGFLRILAALARRRSGSSGHDAEKHS
jgi:hypothetical protein